MKTKKLNLRFIGIGLLAIFVGGVVGCNKPPQVSPVERGSYLVTVGGCHDCHSPKVYTSGEPEPDKSRLLSGHPASEAVPAVPAGIFGPKQWGALTENHFTAWAGPWGISFATNLTPHATGLASWTPETFIQAMRTGKHAGVGRPILTPMPWPNYGQMRDEDLRALFAYLKSLPPISNSVPQPIPPPPAIVAAGK